MQDRNLIPFISQKELERKVQSLAKKISTDYKDKHPILVGILKGSFVFLADLVRYINIAHEVDFISVASYGSSTQASGVVRLIKDLNVNIEGRNVIIIEDIVDTGLTLNYIRDNLLSRKPKSVAILTLLEKRQRRPKRIPIKYVGFKIPPDFVVGYGLDYDEKYRNLPYIAKLKF